MILATLGTPAAVGQVATADISGWVTERIPQSPFSFLPIQDICVDVFDSADALVIVASGATASDGTYLISGIPAGDYKVEFWDCTQGAFLSEFYANEPSFESADVVRLPPGASASNINAQLDRAGFIAGTVTDTSGAPLPDICVEVLASWVVRGFIDGEGVTDAAGFYEVPVPSGSYHLLFVPCAVHASHTSSWFDGAPLRSSAKAVAVVAGATTYANAVLAAGELTSALLESGATLSTDWEGDGATVTDPIEASVTTNVPNLVLIDQTPASKPLPVGWARIGDVTLQAIAPSSLSAALTADASRVRGAELGVFVDGLRLVPCRDLGVGIFMAWCVQRTAQLADGDATVEISLQMFSERTFTLAIRRARDVPGVVETASGLWRLGISFYFGNPGDYPIVGDWNCDGTDTPGMYRQSDGFVYLRNSNTQGAADTRFFFGNPGDIPLAGDFDGDGCDTISIYRPAEGRMYVINRLGSGDGVLGQAEVSYFFGNPGDKPFVGDFNGDGIDTLGLHRESSGLVYFRNSHSQGFADFSFIYGNPGDRIIAGDWIGQGFDTVGIYRPSNLTFYLRYSNTTGNADWMMTRRFDPSAHPVTSVLVTG